VLYFDLFCAAGDGSNFVICFAGELLAQAEELIGMGLHVSDIIAGYTKSAAKALEIVEELSIEKYEQKDMFDEAKLVRALQAPMGSKQHGYEGFLAPLVAKACLSVLPKNPYNFTVDSIRVCKLLGGSLNQSEVINGVVISTDTLTSIKALENVKVAVFTCALAAADTETKGTVLIHNASELMNFNASEEKEIEKQIKAIYESGIRLVITGSTVDDMAKHFLEKFGIMTIKISSKFELRRICRATGARALVNLGAVSAEEAGFAGKVYVREVGLTKITVIQQNSADYSQVATIVLRASTSTHLNDVERAIDDGVNTVRALTRDSRLVAGAGAFEIELARRLQQFAATESGLEQYALSKFAQSLEVIPRALAENAGRQ
jgi:T-complex protein 1 subunit theta